MEEDEADRLDFAYQRIAVLEQIVSSLATKAGAPPEHVQKWREGIGHWPDGESVSESSRYLIDWARSQE